MSEELKLEACPFCGGNPILFEGHSVRCDTRGCAIERDYIDPAAWNRRSPSPEFAALVKAVDMLRGDEDFHEALVGSHQSVDQRIRALFDAATAAERALAQQKGGECG